MKLSDSSKTASILDGLKLAVIECPYDSWDDSFTTEMFIKTTRLKINGYKNEYPYGVLPIDTSDFVGTHLLICVPDGTGLRPIIGYRSITADRCKIHSLTFPPLSLARTSNATEHAKAIENIMARCEHEKKQLAYLSSITIDPVVRQDRELVTKLWEIVKAMLVHSEKDRDIAEVISGGNVRFKMHRFHYDMGFQDLNNNKRGLPPINVSFAFGEQVMLYHRKIFSEYALLNAEKYRALWEDRNEVKALPKQERKKAA